MKLLHINTTGWNPGTEAHIRHVLKCKHGKEVQILYKAGGEVNYCI